MQAAENFKRQENPAGFGEVPSTVSQPIQEESEEEEEVCLPSTRDVFRLSSVQD